MQVLQSISQEANFFFAWLLEYTFHGVKLHVSGR